MEVQRDASALVAGRAEGQRERSCTELAADQDGADHNWGHLDEPCSWGQDGAERSWGHLDAAPEKRYFWLNTMKTFASQNQTLPDSTLAVRRVERP